MVVLIPNKNGLIKQHPLKNEPLPKDPEQKLEKIGTYMDKTKKPVVKNIMIKNGIKQKEYIQSIGKSQQSKISVGKKVENKIEKPLTFNQLKKIYTKETSKLEQDDIPEELKKLRGLYSITHLSQKEQNYLNNNDNWF